MVRFFGKASGKVDDKGRIVFPAIYRDAMARAGVEDMTLVIKKSVLGDCLNLFTREEWERRSDLVLEGLDPELNPGHAAFWSKYNDGVWSVVPDWKLCRLNIPSELLEQTGLTKEVVFAGVGYKIEIWPKDRRESTLMSDGQFKETAARLSENR